jgi:hypothetical protein
MAPYDDIKKQDADDERIAFARKLLDTADDVISFVDQRLGWNGETCYDGILGGSFNLSLKLNRGLTDECVVIRFPAPKKVHEAWREEKVRNEVQVMSYLREHTSIPVPRIRFWGSEKESPRKLGPFIVMDYIHGENLGQFLAPPTDDLGELVFLDPNFDEAKLDVIYDQLAGFMLELWHCQFPRIGAISKDAATGKWDVTSRPFTYDMNEVVTVGGCSAEHFAKVTTPFQRASDYFNMCADHFKLHLEEQRNIAGLSKDEAWSQYVARHCYPKLIATHGNVDDTGPCRLFCDDLRPTNMLIDPDTLRIVAVFDFEFTNAMPAQYIQDVPWWLLLQNPAEWLRESTLDEFLRRFEPKKEQFIRAVERVEAKASASPGVGEQQLSSHMRESWDSGRFFFNLATRCSFDVDDFYWHTLHREGMGEAMLDSATLSEKEAFLERKMRQVEEYIEDKSKDGRFD